MFEVQNKSNSQKLTLATGKTDKSSLELTVSTSNNKNNSALLTEKTKTNFENKNYNLGTQLLLQQKLQNTLPDNFDKNKTKIFSDEECYDSYMSVDDDWTIEWSQIEKHEYVGAGTFAQVYKGAWHGPIAIKMLRYSSPNDEQFRDFQNEINILRKTRHINIVLFMGHCKDPLAIIMQWCEGRSLYCLLHVEETLLELCQILKIAQQIAIGMDYLHSKSIIHRDLKSNSK